MPSRIKFVHRSGKARGGAALRPDAPLAIPAPAPVNAVARPAT
jgi:hypothetical protein